MNQCIDCKKNISCGHKRCKKCAKQGCLHSWYGRKHAEESKLKISKSLAGRRIPKEVLKKMSISTTGKNNSRFKDGRTMGEYFCLCGEKLGDYRAKMCATCSSKEHKKRMSYKNNPNWNGGKSFEPYPLSWNKKLREEIRRRDKFKCQVCGIPETDAGRKLSVHHINYKKKNNLSSSNLISLCGKCHCKTNVGDRNGWIKYFKEIQCVF